MCVCIHIYVCVYIYIYSFYMHIYISIFIFIYLYIYIFISICAYNLLCVAQFGLWGLSTAFLSSICFWHFVMSWYMSESTLFDRTSCLMTGRVAWMYRSKPSTELRNFTRCCIRYPCRIFIRDNPLSPPPPLPAVSQGCKPSRRPSSACGRLLGRVSLHEASVDIL